MTKAYSYIRFSSKAQERGSSVERQTAATVEFAKRHGLDLQDTTFRDLGVSAFRGKHARMGALRAFVEAVEEGKIEKGSWLLVESLDRISREQLADAQSRLSSLLSLGITVATIADGQVYEPSARNNLGDAISILVSLSRSHEESKMKSQRAKGSWAKTRRLAKEGTAAKARGGRLPLWLRWNEAGEIEEIPEKVELVRWIFRMALDGLGGQAIARKLNEAGHTTYFGKQWSMGSVAAILSRRYVLGEWQPHTTHIDEDGKRIMTPEGAPLKIYPQIISEQDWLAVQKSRKGRDNLTGRAASKSLDNVFSGLARCHCGAPLRYVRRKDKSPALLCRTSEYGHDCAYRKNIQYQPFEALMLTALSRLDYSSLFPDGRSQLEQKREDIRSGLLVVEEEEKTAARRKERAITTLLDSDDEHLQDAMRGAVSDAESSLRELQIKREELQTGLVSVSRALEGLTSSAVSLQDLANLLKEEGGKEKINQLLKGQIESMVVDAKGGTCDVTLRHTGSQLRVVFSIKPRNWARPASGEWTVEKGGKPVSGGSLGAKE